MKKIIDHVPSVLATQSTTSQSKLSTERGLPEIWVLAIFKKFQLRYLHKWTSAIDGIEEDTAKEWGCVLSGLTGNDITRGLKGWNESWPPSAIDFLKACKGQLKNEFGLNYIPQYYRQTTKEKLIENDECKKNKKQIAEKNLKEMRDKINAQ